MLDQPVSAGIGTAGKPAFHTNIPAPLTPLIGREDELARACAFLQYPLGRLLTFTGPGGVGKTRLALAVSATLVNSFPDGISFVSLVPIRDPQFVLPAIARALGVQEGTDQSLFERLTSFLLGRNMLLLLDNFEQIVSAAPILTALLEACPSLKALVTSRETLRVRGEQELVVLPLALPALRPLPTPDALSTVAAIELFVHCAREIKANFQITPANAELIAQICIRLDGLPLALELAATRLKLLSLPALLSRLDHRLQVLTRGSRGVDERQQTLFNTLQWSYELLSPTEQQLFRSLAAFTGGWTLTSAQAICANCLGGPLDVEDVLASLVDKSLVRQSMQADGELRFSLLETIQEFALDCLDKHGEMRAIRWAHAVYFLSLVETIEPELIGPRQVERLEELEQEHANLRAALKWALAQEQVEDKQRGSQLALRLSSALRVFWTVRGYWSEGRTFLERALAVSLESISSLRARALWTTANLAFQQDDNSHARMHAEDSLALYRALGDTQGIVNCLSILGSIAANQSDYLMARALTEESLALARNGDDKARVAKILRNLGEMVNIQGDYLKARAFFEESLQIQQALGNKNGIAWSLFNLVWTSIVSLDQPAAAQPSLAECLALARQLNDKGIIVECLLCAGHLACIQDDLAQARSLLEEGLGLTREIEDVWASVEICCALAKVVLMQADLPAASAYCEESLKGARQIGSKDLLASALERFAEIVVSQGQAVWATRIWGFAETLRSAIGAPITPLERSLYDRKVSEARVMLGVRGFTAAWATGQSMPLDQALIPPDAVTLMPQDIPQAPVSTPMYPAELTKREVEVLRLVAQGLTNPQIAEQLVISRHTANAHVSSILSKLGMTSRNAIMRFAYEHHLL